MNSKVAVMGILVILLLSTFAIGFVNGYSSKDVKKSANDENIRYLLHDVIRINNDNDFANQAASEGWPGNGSVDNPYIIQNYEINAQGNGSAIYIGNTTAYFVIKYCYLHSASNQYTFYLRGAGIMLYNVKHGIIRNNLIKDNQGEGIYLKSSDNNNIINNNITNNDEYGIYIYGSNDNTIINNDVTSNGKSNYDGVYVAYSSGNAISSNYIANNKNNGIKLYHETGQINNNTVSNNGASGIYVDNSNNNQIYENKVKDNQGRGIYVYSSQGSVIMGNEMMNNSIFLAGDKSTFTTQTITDNNTVNGKPIYYYKNENMNNATVPSDAGEVIMGNVSWLSMNNLNLSNGDVGIEIGFSSHISIVNSTAYSNNYYGVYLQDSSNINVFGNLISKNHGNGIHLLSSNYVVIKNNNVSQNKDNGIYLKDSNNNNISENYELRNSHKGISLESSNNNNIIGNIIMKDGGIGIYIESSQNNVVKKNDIYRPGNGGIKIESSSSIIVKNNTIYGSLYKSIYLYKASYDIITENNITNSKDDGMFLYYSERNKITNNSVNNSNKIGIHLVSSGNNTLHNNSISNTANACIGIYTSWNNTIIDNEISEGGYGIYISSSQGSVIMGNEMMNNSIFLAGDKSTFTTQTITDNNTVNGKPIYYYKNENMNNATVPSDAGEVIMGNVSWLSMNNLNLSNGDVGIEIGFSSHISIVNNTVARNKHQGIYLLHSTYINISASNIYKNNGDGIYMNAINQIQVMGNEISKSHGYGIYITSPSGSYSTQNVFVSNNSILSSGKDGIYVEASQYIQISNNSVLKSGNYGIHVKDSYKMNINENNISGSGGYGICVCTYSSNIYIKNNTIYNSGSEGIHLTVGNNLIFGNLISSNMGNGIYDSAGNNKFENNTIIRNKKDGIYLNDIPYYETISGNKIAQNNKNGVDLYISTRAQIERNNITGNQQHGIYFWESWGNSIIENVISNNSGFGIYLSTSSTSNKIFGNTLINDSIILWGDSSTLTSQNIPINNTVNGKPIYYYKNENMNNTTAPSDAGEIILGNVEWFNIENVSISGGDVAVEVGYLSHINIENCTFNDNNNYGIYLYDAKYTTVENNTFVRNGNGIRIEESNSNTILNNSVEYNRKAGIYIIYYSKYNLISGNNISKNGGNGISIKYSDKNKIIGNDIDRNVDGIHISSSNSNVIMYNKINNNSHRGVYISASYNNIVENEFINNMGYAIYIDYGSGSNTIYNNTFCYNHGSGDKYNSSYIQAYDVISSDKWNSPDGYGNYWYDWANNNDTNDQNHDGVVDWPYRIAGGGNRDHYPRKYSNCTLPPLPPTAPLDLKAISGDGYVNLTWQKPLGNGSSPITQYKIYRDGVLVGIVSSNQLWFNDTNVQNGQTYTYYVTAVNSVGESEPSNEVSATPKTHPSAPQNLQATAGLLYVNLSWSPPANDGGSVITEYKIYRGTFSGGESYLATVDGSITWYNDTSVSKGQTYYYYVTAVNDAGESDNSTEINATTPTTVPSAPQDLTATTGDGYVNLTWSPPADNGGSAITEYRIYRNGVLIKIKTVSGNQLWFNDTNVQNGQTYTYYVTAVNSVGESNPSNEVQATPGGAVPEFSTGTWIFIVVLIALLGVIRVRKRQT